MIKASAARNASNSMTIKVGIFMMYLLDFFRIAITILRSPANNRSRLPAQHVSTESGKMHAETLSSLTANNAADTCPQRSSSPWFMRESCVDPSQDNHLSLHLPSSFHPSAFFPEFMKMGRTAPTVPRWPSAFSATRHTGCPIRVRTLPAKPLILSKKPRLRFINIKREEFHVVVAGAFFIGDAMSKGDVHHRLVDQGIHFRVTAGFMERDCIVSKNALAYLGRTQGGSTDFAEIYARFEENIHSVARRLVVAGESASPLILGAAYFVNISAPSMS